jgi:phosphoenolpyruvate carboxykinase (GTP)
MPRYEDLARLFKDNLGVEYSRADYVKQFTIRVPENLAKFERVEKIYRETVADTPAVVFETFEEIRGRLKAASDKHGDYISPFDLTDK